MKYKGDFDPPVMRLHRSPRPTALAPRLLTDHTQARHNRRHHLGWRRWTIDRVNRHHPARIGLLTDLEHPRPAADLPQLGRDLIAGQLRSLAVQPLHQVAEAEPVQP